MINLNPVHNENVGFRIPTFSGPPKAAAQCVPLSGEKAFKMCYPELFKGITNVTNEQADGLIAALYGNELLTPSERTSSMMPQLHRKTDNC